MADVAVTYLPKSSDELRAQWLQDFAYAAELTGIADPPVEPGTDAYLNAEADSQIAMIGIQNIALAADDANLLTAGADGVERHRKGMGLPEVAKTGSSGKLVITVLGTTTIANGTELKLKNGLRIKTVGTVVNPADQDEIDVTAIDKGALTNAAGGEEVTFVSAPINVDAKAKVSQAFPLVGGTDAEDTERKRDRCLNTLQNKPGGGNWAQLVQFVLDNFGFIRKCYVYAAPGGPSSQLVVPTRLFDRDNNDYSRAPSSALLLSIRQALQADANTGIASPVRAATDQLVDFALAIAIPRSTLGGGNGKGWTDTAVWPSLVPADSGTVAIASVGTNNDQITVDAQTTTTPVDGQTNIAWWSPADRKFYHALVTAHSGTAAAWVLTLDRPLVGKDGVGPAIGDFISPSAQNLSAYGDTWVKLMEELGPGEMTADVNRLPRSARQPDADDEDPSSITNATLTKFVRSHPEVTELEFASAATTTPTVPASVDDPPNILVPRHLAFYPA